MQETIQSVRATPAPHALDIRLGKQFNTLFETVNCELSGSILKKLQ